MEKVVSKINSVAGKTLKPDLIALYDKSVPHIIKYMGSKKNILEFVIEAINDVYKGGKIYDLFAGTSILSGALGKIVPMHSNDVQEYSSILANTYLSDNNWDTYSPTLLNEIVDKAAHHVDQLRSAFPDFDFSYPSKMTIADFVSLEEKQQSLINTDFGNLTHHLFTKNYSGTYWSYQQCLWIDSIRKVAEDYKETPIYYIILSSLMYAMSYNSQSTGHYAQFRDATNKSSKTDILTYRRREILPYFRKKFEQLQSHLGKNQLEHSVTSLDYRKCLDLIVPGSLVYADPPYAFVHYSRFYHALETLVKYDYPEVKHKGRYRLDRHQSPFCKNTEVKGAFKAMFDKIKAKNAELILSYSNTGMVTLKEITNIATSSLGNCYNIKFKECNHIHSTMGRSDDKNKAVKEYLIITELKNKTDGRY